jgi:F-type H+-transporting ATPase subunit b
MNNPLVQLDPGLFIWTIAVFLVLLTLLRKFAWMPLLNALEARRQTIQKALDDAERARQELERVREESSTMLSRARLEADGIISRTRADAERLQAEMKQKARAEAEAIARNAERQIQLETQKALRQIRNEAAEMSVMIASKLIRRNLSKEDNARLIEEALQQTRARVEETEH